MVISYMMYQLWKYGYHGYFIYDVSVVEAWSEWSEWDNSCAQCGGNQTRRRDCEGDWYQCTDGSNMETRDCPPCRTLSEVTFFPVKLYQR